MSVKDTSVPDRVFVPTWWVCSLISNFKDVAATLKFDLWLPRLRQYINQLLPISSGIWRFPWLPQNFSKYNFIISGFFEIKTNHSMIGTLVISWNNARQSLEPRLISQNSKMADCLLLMWLFHFWRPMFTSMSFSEIRKQPSRMSLYADMFMNKR